MSELECLAALRDGSHHATGMTMPQYSEVAPEI
jgi:hypothetical protein